MIYRILVIDDSEDDLFFFSKTIRETGLDHQLTTNTSGTGGLNNLRSQTFDCIFLDFYLPDMDGLAVLKQIRKEGNDTPVVMLTGQKNEQNIVRLMQEGAADYLSKAALSPEALRISIEHTYRIYTTQKEKRKAEEALKASEARLAEAQSIAHIGNWEQDFMNNSFLISQEIRRILDYSQEQHLSLLSFCRRIHRQDFPNFIAQVRQLKKQHAYEVNFRYFLAPERMKCLNLKGYLAIGNKAVGTLQDITLLKTALLEAEKANIRSRATSIVLVIAIVIFLLSEAVLDPFIDSLTASVLISLSFKGSIAVALKPIEVFLKKIMMKRLIIP